MAIKYFFSAIGEIIDALGVFEFVIDALNFCIMIINKIIYYITLAVTLGAVQLKSNEPIPFIGSANW